MAKRDSYLELMLAAIPDGRAIALSFARQISIYDKQFLELIQDYDQDPEQDLGDLCKKHEIPPAKFMSDITKEAYPFVEESLRFAEAISTSIVAKRLPKVVERGLIEGAKAEGIVDRHYTLQKQGFHVTPKGNTINVNQLNQQNAGLTPFEEEAKSLSEILQEEDHLLEEGKLEPDYIEAETEEEEVPA